MDIIHNLETLFHLSKYLIVFIGCIIEGPIIMITSGFLLRLGQFEFLPLYFSLVSGDFVADIFWYFVGRYGARTLIDYFGKFFKISKEAVEKIQENFHKHQNRILIVSKLTMGFGFAVWVLVTAGIMRVPFKRYLLINLFGGFVWTIFLVAVGYFFGNVYTILPSQFKFTFVIIIFVAVVYLIKSVNTYLKKKRS